MAIEIERKFLVTGNFRPYVIRQQRIVQGYLSSVAERSVRVRIMDDNAFLTIKGISDENGMSRFEWEKEIGLVDAEALLKLCEPGKIEKMRFIVPENGGLFFEVDQFFGENEGLIIAEIELPSESYSFLKPSWLGKEITGDLKYYNASLTANPFCNWK